MNRPAGFALVAVLMVLTLIGLMAIAVAFQARLSGGLALQRQRSAIAEGQAYAGLELAMVVLNDLAVSAGDLPASLPWPDTTDFHVELVDYRLIASDAAVLVLRGGAAGGRSSYLLEAGIVARGSELVVSWVR